MRRTYRGFLLRLSPARGIFAVMVTAYSLLVPAPAFARSWTAATNLSLHASDTSVHKPHKVTFSGRLSSSRRKCRQHRTIRLVQGRRDVAATTTHSRGGYAFRRTIGGTGRWHTEYHGNSFGVFPNVQTCEPSVSNIVRVRTR
jgi:hypothetical protein